MPFSARMAAIFGPTPFTYCTGVVSSSKGTVAGTSHDKTTTLARNANINRMAARRPSLGVNFLKSLVAVLAGNAVYFLLLEPHMPQAARHRLFQFDLGLIIDAWVCLIFWGVIEMLVRRKRKAKKFPN